MTNGNQNDLPVANPENFIAEAEVMDLSKLKDKTYMVAVNTGPRDEYKLLASSIHGPYNFYEMCEEVGVMWQQCQHHAKVYVLERDRKVAPKFLDECTIDYIEAHFKDILTDALLEGVFEEGKTYTCQANLLETNASEDPRNKESENVSV